MTSDTLFPVRNSFYLGAYQAAIAEAADLDTLSEREKIERDVFVYRSYIELGSYELVISEVTPSSSQALQAVKLLAQYASSKLQKEEVFSTLQTWQEDRSLAGNAEVLLIIALIYANEGNYVEALKACHAGQSLELLAIAVQVLLKIHRADQAQERLKVMTGIDEDATLTQLATAWVGLELGGLKVQEASFIFQELGERYNWTVRLQNSSAVCKLKMGEVEDAEAQLQEAYERDAKNPETLANIVTAGLLLGKPVSRHLNQLKALAPQHAMVQSLQTAEDQFAKAASAF
jgi:coatomer protein complex subunit epsilon